MKLSYLIELIQEELAELHSGQSLASDENEYAKAPKDAESKLEAPRPDYEDYSRDKAADTRGEANDLEDNVPSSEDKTTPDRKTTVLMQKFGHDPLYKAIIDAPDKTAVVTALNKLTKEKGFHSAVFFLNYYQRLGAGGNSAAVS